MKSNYSADQMIFSLDIGSSKIISLAGTVGSAVEVHGISSYYFTNNSNTNDFLTVTKGVICDLESTGARVNQVLNEARINADCGIGGVIVNISGSHVCNLYSGNKLDIDGQSITSDMISQLVSNGRQVEVPTNYEVLDYEVQEYLLDKEHYTINPIHLTANTVESHLNLFLANGASVSNIKKVMRYSGFSLAKLIPSGILSGMAVLNREEKELGCCLIDIGAGTTDLVVYENGFIRYLCSIPVGGENITRDIASVLKISRNLAEDIKLNYGSCSYTSSHNKIGEGVTMTDHRGINTTISRKLLIDVIAERLKDIFEVVKTSLSKQKIYDIINSGIVITGGTALLPNIEEFARGYFGVPVKIGVPHYTGNFADLLTTPKYSTSLGALYFVNEYMLDEVKSGVNKSSFSYSPGRIIGKIRGMFS
jgi:cell division protein FtsA